MVNLAVDSVFSFSAQPVRSATRLGVATTIAGFAYLLFVLFQAIVVGGVVPGWSSVISLVLLLGGLQLCFLGILGEYVARIFEEAKGRPLYVLRPIPKENWSNSDPWIETEMEPRNVGASSAVAEIPSAV